VTGFDWSYHTANSMATAVESFGVSNDYSGNKTSGPPLHPTGRKHAKSDHTAN
jgi:hypothetical protein